MRGHYKPIGKSCIYPNLRRWMNENVVTKKDLLCRMGLTPTNQNYRRLNACLYGRNYPNKKYIDRLLKVTGMNYETLFYTEVEDGRKDNE